MYLDHAATTPIRPEALAAMQEGFKIWANPSSPHAEGRKAKQALENARERIKKALGWDGEVIFTSGASEAARLAFDNANVMHEAVSTAEHDALHHFVTDRGAQEIRFDQDGLINHESLKKACEPSMAAGNVPENRSLVAVQLVNSETGTRQDIDTVAAIIGEYSGILIADCAQSAGKLALPTTAGMVIVSAHKFGGPIGVGALLVKDFAMLKPAGGHERGYRRGTENLPDILGMAAAIETCDWHTTADQREAFIARLSRDRLTIGQQVDYIVPLVHPKMSAQALLIRLDSMGFAVSAGSACSSGTLKKSRVLDAFGVDDETASRTIRVSLGWNTTPEELERFADAWVKLT
ncbi:cysteine desulfurase family protein [Pontixanthobacter gangjinensis]